MAVPALQRGGHLLPTRVALELRALFGGHGFSRHLACLSDLSRVPIVMFTERRQLLIRCSFELVIDAMIAAFGVVFLACRGSDYELDPAAFASGRVWSHGSSLPQRTDRDGVSDPHRRHARRAACARHDRGRRAAPFAARRADAFGPSRIAGTRWSRAPATRPWRRRCASSPRRFPGLSSEPWRKPSDRSSDNGLADTGRALRFPEYAGGRLAENVFSYARDETGVLARGDEARAFAADSAVIAKRVDALIERVDRIAATLQSAAATDLRPADPAKSAYGKGPMGGRPMCTCTSPIDGFPASLWQAGQWPRALLGPLP